MLTLIVIFASGASLALHSFTMVEGWWPVAICAVVAILVSVPLGKLMRPLTKPLSRYLEYPFSFVLSFSILLCSFYALNFWFSDPSSRVEYQAPVIRKYSEERTRSKGGGRRSHGVEKYNVHFVEIELEDGSTIKLERPLKEYLKIKKGSRIDIAEENGLFGVKVIKLNQNK